MLIPRQASATLKSLAQGFPVLAVNGPRQSGKTTLVRECFPDKPYVSLENLDQRESATRDPRGFLARFPDGAILDEAQRCPDLFSYLQQIVDEAKRPGLFVLTGSQQFGLLTGITQSLAGRVALVTLLPFSRDELEAAGRAPDALETMLYAGGYPPIHDHGLDPAVWFANYVATYVERDVRQLVNVRDLTDFQRFLGLCAGRTGQLLNLSALANDAGVTHNTARAWISVLEASYLVHRLPPHHANFNKRLVKAPKLYFLDVGLAAWLAGVRSADDLRTHAFRGALFETWAVGELLKRRFHAGRPSDLYFWRDRTGNEVDVVIDEGLNLAPIEIKSGMTINDDFFTGLRRWRTFAGRKAGPAALIYGGDTALTREDIRVVPWRTIASL